MYRLFINITLLVTLFVLNSTTGLKGQVLAVTDNSESHANRIRNTIVANKEIVNFIEHSLAQRGLPRHLRNLPLLESYFDKNQVSATGAVGIWQIMPAHAIDHGLDVSERSDIYKSTQAAMNSLTKLYNKYGNWFSVLAAYNCGEGNLQKAMSKAGSKKYSDYYIYLPEETKNYIKKYINAANVTGDLGALSGTISANSSSRANISQNPYLDNGDEEEKPKDPSFLTTQINSGYDLDILASVIGTEKSQILIWNPNIEKKITQKSDVNFFLPAELMANFEANRNKILRLSLMK